ncbi:MAG: hypothetical protein GY794_09695, partial [bacterium]|nr:hypothetical protein [bacterium]
MAMNRSMYKRLCDLYGRVLSRMRQSNSELGGLAEARRKAAANPVCLEQMEPRLLLSSTVGSHLFYNDSAFDGNNAAINVDDDAAIATDKVALQELGEASFANYSSYDKGINGVMVDIDNLHGTPILDDFVFRTGTDDQDLSTWSLAPDPTDFSIRWNAGENGSDRLVVVWDDASAVKNAWLQVTVKTTSRTGLYEQEVLYFGSAIGETGDTAGSTRVNATDMLLVRNNPHTLLDPAGIDDAYDFNRDTKVNATDMLIARNNQTDFLSDLALVKAPLNPIEDLSVNIYSASEIRLSWQDKSQSELGYNVLMSSSESGPFKVIKTVRASGTAAVLDGLPSGTSRWFRVEPIAPSSSGALPATNTPTLQVDLPERLATSSGVNHYRIKVTSPGTGLQRGSAAYGYAGTAFLSDEAFKGDGVVVAAESAEKAVLDALAGKSTITNFANVDNVYDIKSGGAYKVGTVASIKADPEVVAFKLDALYGDNQWLLVLEDTYEWTEIDEDFDDFYLTLDVEPWVNLVIDDVKSEADNVIGLISDPNKFVLVETYVAEEINATKGKLEIVGGVLPEGVVLYKEDKTTEVDINKYGYVEWDLETTGHTIEKFYLKVTTPFCTTQLKLTAGSEYDSEWVGPKSCCSCKCCTVSTPGTGDAKTSSLDFSLDLGSVDQGESAGTVSLHANRGTDDLDTPGALHLSAHSDVTVSNEINGESGDPLKSTASDGEVLWLTLGTVSTASKVYVDVHSAGEGGGYSLVFRTATGTRLRTITFQDNDAPSGGHDYEITISQYEGDQVATTSNYWLNKWTPDAAGAPGTWEVTTGTTSSNLQRVETHTSEYDAADDTIRNETTTISEPATGVALSRTAEKYQKYDWGEELIERTVYTGYDSGSQTYTGGMTTTWSYYGDSATDGDNYGNLKLVTDPVGNWTYYKTYSSSGYASEIISQYGANAFNESSGTLAADNITTAYSEYRDWGDTSETLDLLTRTVVTPPTSTGGDAVYSYSLIRVLANSTLSGYEESWSITPVTSTPESGYATFAAFIDAVMAGNTNHLISKSWSYPANTTGANIEYAGQVKKTESPDGSVSIYDYDYANNKTTVQYGLADSSGNIDEGSKTITTVNDAGATTQSEQYERKRENTAWILTSLVKYSVPDSYGRLTTTTYWFGEEAEAELASEGTGTVAYSTTNTYSGLYTDKVTGRDDVITDYDYDNLGRVTSVVTGTATQTLSTERYAYDAAGRQIETRLDVDNDGWDATIDDDIVTSLTTYDLAGRTLSTEDAAGVKTFYTYRIIDVVFGSETRTIRETRAYGHNAA